MTSERLASIIINNYNYAGFLPEAIDSGAIGEGDGEGSVLGELDGVAVLDETSFGGAAQPEIASRRTTIPDAQPLNTIFAARSLEGSAAI